MNNSKWKNILTAAKTNGFSVHCMQTITFAGKPGEFDLSETEYGVVKILDNNTLKETLSIACHSFSYGGNEGLFETWSKEQQENDEDPTGYLTEERVIEQIQCLKRKQ